jgi:hypothetical protein
LVPFADCYSCDDDPARARQDRDYTEYMDMQVFTEENECTWRCVDGYFWNHISDSCQESRTTPCAVGEYLTPHTRDRDSICMPCRSSRQDTFRVFVTDGGAVSTGCTEECVDGKVLQSGNVCKQCDTNRCGIGGERSTFKYMTTVPCEREQPSYCVECPINNPDIMITASGNDICGYSCTKGLYQRPVCGKWDEHFHEKTVNISTNVTVYSSVEVYLPNVHDDPILVFDPLSVFRLTGNIRVTALSNDSIVRAWVHGNAETPIIEFTPRVSTIVGVGSVWQSVSLDWVGIRVVSTQQDFSNFYAIRFEVIDTIMELSDISLSAQTHENCVDDPYTCTECSDTYTLPTNASFIVSRKCEWTCGEDYEFRELDGTGTCVYCPVMSCIVGEYMSDCGICSPCVKNDANAIFTSNGIRDLESSCTTRCMDSHFSDIDTGNCTQCASINASSCLSNSYFLECTVNTNARCTTCTYCQTGMYTKTVCHLSEDTECAVCATNLSATGSLPENGHWLLDTIDSRGYSKLAVPCSWECDTDYVFDIKNGVCKTCLHGCGLGYYETDCTHETEWEGCMLCVVPENAYVTGSGRQTPTSCPWDCIYGFDKADDGATCISTQTVDEVLVPQAPCALTSDSCQLGYYLHLFSSTSLLEEPCTCSSCDQHANASTAIAQFTTRGTCDWVCMYPYVRVGEICLSVRDIRTNSLSMLKSYRVIGGVISPVALMGSMLPFITVLVVACTLILRIL